MADNVTITQGAGTNVATDDVGGVHFQRVKLDVGTDGASTPVVTTLPVNLVAGETHLGQIGAEGDLIDVTLTLDTSAYADGDVMADTQTVSNAVRVTSGRAILQSIAVIDEDDQGQTFDILFFSANRSLGTENSTPSISDANARDFLAVVRISSSDYLDLGGVKVATRAGLGLLLEASGSRDLYVGTIIRGAATYTASGVRLRLGFLWD